MVNAPFFARAHNLHHSPKMVVAIDFNSIRKLPVARIAMMPPQHDPPE
jgi:hypothetical protein